jgi:hypothetical protein
MKRLKIGIVGLTDHKQKQLLLNVQKAITELATDSQIIEVSELDDILASNVVQTPALVIRNQVLSQGFVPESDEIKRLIAAFLPDESPIFA